MSGRTFRLRRGTTSVTLLVGGVAVAVATWVGGSPAWALGVAAAYAVLAALAYVWAGGAGDTAAILRAEPDERQRGLDRDATALTGVAMALAGAVVSIGRTGNRGPTGSCAWSAERPTRSAWPCCAGGADPRGGRPRHRPQPVTVSVPTMPAAAWPGTVQ